MSIILTSHEASEARKSLGLSQSKVANELAISRPYLCQFESGKRILDDGTLGRLREHYEKAGYQFKDLEHTFNGGNKCFDLTITDGFVIAAEADLELIDNLLEEYHANNSRVAEILDHEFDKPQGFFDSLFESGEDEKSEELKQELMRIMMRNQIIVSYLHGHNEIFEHFVYFAGEDADTFESERDTQGERLFKAFPELRIELP